MLPASARPALLQRALVAAGVGVVATIGIAATGAASGAGVEIVVDGHAREISTAGATVADALEDAQVVVGVADEVHPDPATPVEDGLRVEVARAVTVDVNVHGATARRVTAVVDTVDDVLAAASMSHVRAEGAEVTPGWDEPVEDGDTVSVRLPVTVVIEVDGDAVTTDTLATEVGDVLDAQQVEVGSDDVVLPAPASRIVGPTTITVQRVATEEVTEEVPIGYEEVRRETHELERGTTRVEQEGRDGVRVDTYEVTVVDGEHTGRELVDSTVERAPREKIVLVGTREPAPDPAPAPSRPSGSSNASGGGDGVWDRLARCESGGNWSANTGNGYFGGLQFHPQTWRSVGGSGLPHEHSRDEQIRRGKVLQERSGWGQWPACSRRLGLR